MTWFVIRRWKGTIILAAIAGIVAGILISVLTSPRYEVQARLEVQDLNQDFLNMKQVTPLSDDMAASANALSDVQTQIQLLQSDTLLKQVVAEVLNSEVKRGRNRDATAAELDQFWKHKLKIRGVDQTRVIELSIRSKDPELASVFLNRLCADAINHNVASRLEMSQSIGQWMSRLLQGAQDKLRASEAALQQYASSHGLIFTSDNANVAEENLRQIEDAYAQATALRIQKQSRYEKAKAGNANTVPDVLNDSSLKQYEDQLTDLERQRADLAALYTPSYAKIQRLDAQIASVKAALEREKQDIIARIQTDYEQAARQEALLSSAFKTQEQNYTNLEEKSVQYDILRHEVDSNRQLYDSMLQQVKQITIQSAIHPSNIRIVDPGYWHPDQPVWPKPVLACAFGLSLFSFAAILFAFARERADSTLKQPGDAAFFLNLPELGSVPHMPQRGVLAARSGHNVSGGKSLLRLGSRKTAALKDQAFLVAESFRSIATSILFSGPDGNTPQVIVVSSAGPTDGKTTVVANVGAALARSGRRVLLVEGDLRRNRLDRVFDLSNEAGLTTLLEENSLTDGNLRSCVQPTREPGLFVLTGGPANIDTPDLLHSSILRRLIERLKKEFEVILIDTPPLLEIPDARLLGRIADGIIFVTRSRQTTVEAALAATQRLAFDKARVLGVVLNDWNPNESRYYARYSQYVQ